MKCFMVFIFLIFNLTSEAQTRAQTGALAEDKTVDKTVDKAQIKLAFGVYTSDKPSLMVVKFKPLLNRLEQEMSKRLNENIVITLQVFPTYEKGIDAITQNIHFIKTPAHKINQEATK